ncbi:MAG TPA: response regulator [Candidatus Polarisedimenticolia bacterium]|jgi:signal transduction histidine kinase/DNA-binding response OmpR family regulator|nr:response regulator [Candidatus Polarisedimenticolia bacterium]
MSHPAEASRPERLLRILHLEDDPNDAELIRKALPKAGQGLLVEQVSTRSEFARLLGRGAVDLILSDFALPDFDGLSALKLARERFPDVPFILVSGTIGEEAAIESLRSGATDYVLKHRLSRLGPAVSRALEEAAERRKRVDAEEALHREQRLSRLEEARRRRSEERLAAQFDMALALAKSTSLAEATPRILKSVCEVLECEYAALWEVDRQAKVLRCVEIWHPARIGFPQFEELSRRTTFAPGVGLPGRVWASGKPAWIQDVVEDANFPRAPAARREGLHGAYGLPIVLQGEVLGVMEFFSREIREPSSDLVAMLTTVGSQIVQFIEGKHREQELVERVRLTALGADIGMSLTQPGTLRDRLQRCAAAVVKHLDAAFARIWTLDQAGQVLELQASAGLYTHLDGAHSRVPVGKYKIGLIAEERQAHLTNDVLNDPRVGDREWAAREGMAAFAGHPLIARDHLVGVMALFARHPLSDYVLTALATIADNVALGIESEKIEAEREKLEIQFRQAQKMEAVGRLAGGVAHDFNNLLSVILGYGNLMLARSERSEGDRKSLQEMCKAAERAAGLTRQLLAFSRQQVLIPEIFDVRETVKELSKMLGRLIGEDVELQTHCCEEPCHVLADRGQVEQVIMNLVVNSRDAMPQGGKLCVEVRSVGVAAPIPHDHVTMPAGRYVMLEVIDTGTGMDSATQNRVFEPFFTTKEQGKGTGLGLATVYGIVKQSNGYIWVHSEPGKGTKFTIYLPLSQGQAKEAIPVPRGALLRGTGTILLVEDSEALRRLARHVLEDTGYTVLAASSGEEAERLAAGHSGRIDLLLVDVVMPGMNGRELAERLSSLRSEMQILYMSGYTNDAVLQHGIASEAVNFIQKPFTPSVMTRKVREILKQNPSF